MKGSTIGFLAVLIAMMGATGPALSQQPASSTPADASAPAPTETPAAEQPAGPSADTLRKAKSLGMHSEIRKGVTMFCWEDESTGTRFKTKKCTDETGLEAVINSRQAMKDQMKNGSGTSNH